MMLLAGILTLAAGMSGCGLKGPLTLPPAGSVGSTTVTPPAASTSGAPAPSSETTARP